MSPRERARRRALLRVIAAGGATALVARALANGDRPVAQGVVRLDGAMTVRGRPAAVGTPVGIGDRIATGPRSQAAVVVGRDAFLLRADTVVELQGRDTLSHLLVATGRVLSVFSKKPVSIKASTATIGIRGTGAYLEVEPASVYFCLCYGEAVLEAPGMAAPREIRTTHHEQPLLLHAADGAMRAEAGVFRNHTDAELILLESLVGREPPFVKDGAYPSGKY